MPRKIRRLMVREGNCQRAYARPPEMTTYMMVTGTLVIESRSEFLRIWKNVSSNHARIGNE